MTSLKMPQFHRQRYLLIILERAGGSLLKTDLQQLLFLSQQETGLSYYDFVYYHSDYYSFQAEADIELLCDIGWLNIRNQTIKLMSKPKAALKNAELSAITQFIQFDAKRERKLITDDQKCAPSHKKHAKVVFTIGYEGLSFEAYANQLIRHQVRLLCDVRKNPFSRKFGFSKRFLSRFLPELGIDYLHIPDLGIPSEQRKELNTESDYSRLFEAYRQTLPLKQDSLQLLLNEVEEYKRIALTCFEKQPNFCHRHCVSDYLETENRIKIIHL